MKKIPTDPVGFIETVLTHPNGEPYRLHEGQKQLLTGIQRTTVVSTGRQWGKSTSMAAYIVWFAVTHADRNIYIIAPSLSQAKIIYNEVSGHFSQKLMRNNRVNPLHHLVAKESESPFPSIILKNRTEIHARGANSEKYIRGNRAHLAVCDEAAFLKDGVISQVVEPLFTVTGKEEDSALILISTPFGDGEFKTYWDSDETTKFHFPTSSNPHVDMDMLDRIQKRYGEDSYIWRTEYLAEFIDSELQVFPSSAVKACTYDYQIPEPPIEGHKYSIGVDLANRNDYFVAAVFDYSVSPVRLVYMARYQKRGYTFYKNAVRNLHYKYNKAKVLMDSTTLGEAVVEDLKDIHVEGYTFTMASKHDLITGIVNYVMEQRVMFPPQEDILKEFQYYYYKITSAKNIRMEAKNGYHDDIITAFALGLKACSTKRLGFFLPVRTSPSGETNYLKLGDSTWE